MEEPSFFATRFFLSSLLYSLGQIVLGLFLHPYQTMQSLVEEKIFVWLVFLPGLLWLLASLIGRLFYLLIFPYFFDMMKGVWFFLVDWVGFFCLFWQILLIYLLVRFKWAYRTNIEK